MPAKLDSKAIERGTFAVTMSFTDDEGIAVSPTTLTWTLTDLNGTIINDRKDVVVAAPSSEETITLQGDDLVISDRSAPERILLVKGTYTSGLGVDLPLRDSVIFVIEDFFEPPEVWEDQIILLSEVRSILQILSSDTSRDSNIETLIPIIQAFVIEYCENNFEKVGHSLKEATTISFENEDGTWIEDYRSAFLDNHFDDDIEENSVTSISIAFIDGGAGEDSITVPATDGFIATGFKKSEKISVLDSASNDGFYTICSVSTDDTTDTIKVATGSLIAELAGESITVTTGINVRVNGSKRNDGKYNVKKVAGNKLTLRDDEILIEESVENNIKLEVITGMDFPEGIKLPVAKLIGYELERKGKGLKSEKLGDYSVTFSGDYPESLKKELDTWVLNDIHLATTYDDIVDEEEYLDTNWPVVD